MQQNPQHVSDQANAAPTRPPDPSATPGEIAAASGVEAASADPQVRIGEPLPSLAPGSQFSAGFRDAKLEYRGYGMASGASYFFKELQTAYQTARTAGIDPQTPRDTLLRDLDELIAKRSRWSATNAVVRYCVAVAEDLQSLCTEWSERAYECYRDEQTEYDKVMPDLIPEEFRRRATWIAAVRAYDGKANSTALGDWSVFMYRLKSQAQQPLRGIATGLPSLDQAMLGLDGLTIVAGPTAAGKTALALNILAHALANNNNLAVLYLLLDPGMTRERIYERLLCLASGLDSRSVRNPKSPAEQQLLDNASKWLQASVLPRLKVVSVPPLGRIKDIDAAAIHEYRQQLITETDADQALVVIDLLGYLDVPANMSPSSIDADIHRMSMIQEARYKSRSRTCPSGDPYLVIGEITKSWDGREALTGNDLIGSTRQQYTSDTILLLEPKRLSDPTAKSVDVILRVAKARDGAIRTSIPLVFDHTCCRFREAPTAPATSRAVAPETIAAPGGLNPMAGLDED